MFNNVRYNHWVRKMDRWWNKHHKTFGYLEKDKIFKQTREGKLSKSQCDALMEKNESIFTIARNRNMIQQVVNIVLCDDYTAEEWYRVEDTLIIKVKESEKLIGLYEGLSEVGVFYDLRHNGELLKGNRPYYGMTIDEFRGMMETL